VSSWWAEDDGCIFGGDILWPVIGGVGDNGSVFRKRLAQAINGRIELLGSGFKLCVKGAGADGAAQL
jgi:hypothetical protein